MLTRTLLEGFNPRALEIEELEHRQHNSSIRTFRQNRGIVKILLLAQKSESLIPKTLIQIQSCQWKR